MDRCFLTVDQSLWCFQFIFMCAMMAQSIDVYKYPRSEHWQRVAR